MSLAAAATLLLLGFQDAQALAKSGSEKLDRKDNEGALRDFTRALELDPKLIIGYIGRGLARSRLDARAEALEDLTHAIILDPAASDGYFWRATVYDDVGESRLAVRDYTRAFELGVTNPLLFERRALSFNRLGEFGKAEADATRALDGGRRSPGLYAFRSSIRHSLLDFRGAVADASRSILLEPKDPAVYGRRFTSYFALQSWDNALRDLRKQKELTASSDISAFWVYLVRARKGEGDEATKELRAHIADFPLSKPSYPRSILSFLLGELPDGDLLALPAPKGVAQFVLGQKRLLAGDAAGATAQFAKVVELMNTSQDQHFLAQAEILAAGAVRRREVLGELEKRFRALGPIEVQLQGEGQDLSQDTHFKSATLFFDLGRDRLQIALTEHDRKGDRDTESFFVYDQMTLLAWGGIAGVPRKADCAPFLSGGMELGTQLGSEIDRIVPPDPGAPAEKPEVIGPRLMLSVEGKPDKNGNSTFVFQYGRGPRPAGWLAEGISAADAVLRETEATVTVEIPSKRKTILIDRKTGFFQSIEARDYDGVVIRKLKVTSLRKIDAFPELKRPSEFQPLPIDFKKLISELSTQRVWLSESLRDTVERWDRVAAAGKEDEVRAVFTRWASKVEDGLYAWGVRQLARKHLQSLIDLGTPVETLLKDADAESKRFAERMASQRKELMDFLEGQVATLRNDVEDDVFRSLLDNRLHGRLREVLERSLRFETVERLRRDTYGERLDSLFRDELATFRQL